MRTALDGEEADQLPPGLVAEQLSMLRKSQIRRI